MAVGEQDKVIGLYIKEAREKKGWSQDKLAQESGTSQTTIDKIERGLTARSKYLPDIAKSLGIPMHVLDPRLGSTRVGPPPKIENETIFDYVDVYPTIEGLDGWITIGTEKLATAGRPSFLEGVRDAYCLYVSGTSMIPEFEPGDIIYVNPLLPPIPNSSCLFVDARTNGRALIRRVLHADRDEWLVKRWNPAETETLERSAFKDPDRIVGKYSRR